MAKISGMQRYAEQYAQQKAATAQLLMTQYMTDTLHMALHQAEGWGYDRIMRLDAAWHKIRDEYAPAVNPSNPEADVYQEHMDRVLLEIINGRQELYPFASRYPALREIKYRR